jgi:hypothetical protein
MGRADFFERQFQNWLLVRVAGAGGAAEALGISTGASLQSSPGHPLVSFETASTVIDPILEHTRRLPISFLEALQGRGNARRHFIDRAHGINRF